MESWYQTELPKVNFGYREFLDPSMVLVMWHDSVPTYCQATFPYHISQQSVISAGLGWRDNKFCHQVWPGVRHLTNNNCSVNAAPCRLLARGEESINMKSCVSPTSTTIRTERLLTWIIVTRPDQCPEGQEIIFPKYQMSQIWHTICL